MLFTNVLGPFVTKSVTLFTNVFGPSVTNPVTLVLDSWICPSMVHRITGEQPTVLTGVAPAGTAVSKPAALINPATIRVFFIFPLDVGAWTSASTLELTQSSQNLRDLHRVSRPSATSANRNAVVRARRPRLSTRSKAAIGLS